MKLLDLFSGIGGFSLAAHQINGWSTVAFVERDKFCQAVLKTQFGDNIEIFDDITTFDGKPFQGRCDIVTAGFPCQPFSAAGKRQGDSDDRFLWPETVRVVDEARPEWCVFENVAGLLSMVESDSLSDVEIKEIQLFHADENYLVNTVIERVHRRIVGRILADIEAIGYSPLRMPDRTPVILCLPACAVGAWHRRDRLWIVAYDERAGAGHKSRTAGNVNGRTGENWGAGIRQGNGAIGSGGIESADGDVDQNSFADSDSDRRDGGVDNLSKRYISQHEGIASQNESERKRWIGRVRSNDSDASNGSGIGSNSRRAERLEYDHWLEAATELCRVVYALPGELDAADIQTLSQAVKLYGRDEVERKTGLDLREVESRVWRTERLKSLGNSIVPDVVLQIFRVINSINKETKKQ